MTGVNIRDEDGRVGADHFIEYVVIQVRYLGPEENLNIVVAVVCANERGDRRLKCLLIQERPYVATYLSACLKLYQPILFLSAARPDHARRNIRNRNQFLQGEVQS